MRKGLQSFIKYSLSLAIAIFLFWYLYKDIDFQSMMKRLTQADLKWVYLSIIFSIISHYFRALRWNMLLKPMGYQPSSLRTFWAVMVGYLINFVLPRAGEISRCGVLQKTDKVPISKGIGSVVTERIIDLMSLMIVVGLTLIIEFDVFSGFFLNLVEDKTSGFNSNLSSLIITLIIIAVAVIVSIILLRRNAEKLNKNPLYNKVASFLRQIVEGITSIKHLKNPVGFIVMTVIIWVLYYLMTYVVVFSLEETSGITASAGLTMLVLGGIGMATPVQGGIGAFHYLMSSGLLLYGIAESDGILFAFLIHTTNSLAVMAVGLVALFVSMTIPRKDSAVLSAGNDSINQ